MRVNRPRAAMRSSRRSGAAWSRRSTRSRRRAISRVRSVGLMPRAISYWCRRGRAGGGGGGRRGGGGGGGRRGGGGGVCGGGGAAVLWGGGGGGGPPPPPPPRLVPPLAR